MDQKKQQHKTEQILVCFFLVAPIKNLSENNIAEVKQDYKSISIIILIDISIVFNKLSREMIPSFITPLLNTWQVKKKLYSIIIASIGKLWVYYFKPKVRWPKE